MLLKYAIKDFKEDREFRQVSPKTIQNYMETLEQFQSYCTNVSIIDISDITHKTVTSYLKYCQRERRNNAVSVNSKLRILKIFFNYLEKEEIISHRSNPCEPVSYLRTDVKIEVFTDQQIKQMLGYYRRLKARDKSFWAYRDSTIIVTLLGSGCRLGELCNIKWSDIDLINRHIVLFGKLHKQTSIPIAEKLQREFLEYKLICERQFPKLPDYVFVDRQGKQLKPNAIKCIFKRLKKVMNFNNMRCSAGDFRHTYAHRFLLNGGDVFSLQKLLRHYTISTTERYLALWGTALKEQNDKYNPLNFLDI